MIVEAEVRPTEVVEKVKKAIENLYDGELAVVEGPNGWKTVKGESHDIRSLDKLRSLAKSLGIEPALKSYLLKNREGNRTRILLHKQAAYMGRISLIDDPRESPMGPISISIASDDLDAVINYLTS